MTHEGYSAWYRTGFIGFGLTATQSAALAWLNWPFASGFFCSLAIVWLVIMAARKLAQVT